MLEIRKLSEEETKKIYETQMQEDFPADERKPLERILSMMRDGHYSCFGFYEGESLAGYGFFCDNKEHTYTLLDYYAVSREKRGQGYGQKIMKLMREIYKDYQAVLLESEDPAFSHDDQDRETRVRRLRFYEKCGLSDGDVTACIFGVHYVIRILPCRRMPDRQEVEAVMREIYRIMVKEEYQEQVKISAVSDRGK